LKCPNCGEKINKDWVRCPNCHEFLTNKCLKCNKEIDTKWDICPFCGTDVNIPIPQFEETKTQIYSDEPTKEISSKSKSPFSIQKVTGLLVLISFVAIIILYSLYTNQPPINGQTAEEYFSQGLAYYNQENYEGAIINFEKCLSVDPKYKEAWKYKGDSIQKISSNYSEAIECYDKAISIDPNYQESWNNKGLALRKLGRYSEAIACYDKAIAIDPNKKDPWNNKGSALYDQGK